LTAPQAVAAASAIVPAMACFENGAHAACTQLLEHVIIANPQLIEFAIEDGSQLISGQETAEHQRLYTRNGIRRRT
jgi:hypothetical protein